jgi:cytochrome c-type biogenesis protein CcmH
MKTAMWRSVVGVVAVLLGSTGLASAQTYSSDDVFKDRTHAIAMQLRCPVCQGLSLADSQSELSQQMRGVITEQLRAGKTDQQVIDYFVAKYGEWILLEPKARGFNLVAYLLPLVMLAAGIGVIFVSVRKWTRAGAGTETPSVAA